MRIENRTRKTMLGSNVRLVTGWWGRFRGYMGHTEPPPGEGILLIPCDAVHTFWMRFDLDILFVDPHGEVLQVVRSMRPWKWTRRVRGARSVLEVPAGIIDGSSTQVGDRLTWWDPAPAPVSDLIANRKPWSTHSMVRWGGDQ